MSESAQLTTDLLVLEQHYRQLGPNARRILLRLADRLATGAKQYPEDFTQRRDWDREAIEELLDAACYLEARGARS
jgi:hypothetical protein